MEKENSVEEMSPPIPLPNSVVKESACYLVWPAIASLPLILTTNNTYKSIFPASWYDTEARDYWSDKITPLPLGLSLGLLAVVIGQVLMLVYFCLRRSNVLGKIVSIQKVGAVPYDLKEGLMTHLAQPEGFVLLGGYLIGTWMLGLMPSSYYSFSGGINWVHVLAQLLLQDFIQYVMHRIEHSVNGEFYKVSHKPHHRFTNPRLFDAFNGSIADTFLMILVPLFCTARVVNANVWSYMAFGSLYANWLTLIHSEYAHPWDGIFRSIGFGTAADHHVHHKLFKYNYGHLFLYWDYVLNTYKDPSTVPLFNKEI